ncbi:hypothetical protein DENIS_0759 [Desulfonema ishimotonii]|uniref:TonB-dependent receptor n=1 Tax=Desulfonema ishimotonii TaxID=45657 RepID=A0A401FS83_9BACT|nr:TonB-dependent receptor [Desulfonema ishimotonii]GBC59818.1 hypothetical protein DENIS_0759 [Desulfonema ishimotonii]
MKKRDVYVKNGNNCRTIAVIILILICVAAGAAAEENAAEKNADDQRVMRLDTVVVTAEKGDATFQTGDVDLEQTPAFYSVITRDEFEGKIEDLSEVIRKEAGIQVRQSGGLGSFASVSLRGSSGEQVMIFLDGVLLNDASGGGVDLSNIALSDVESVEIYRGVTPVNFGKASVGGVVNIRTRRSEDGFSASASAGGGSFDTWKGSAFFNHKPGKWDYLFSADYTESKNDFKFLNDKGTSYNPDDDEVERRNNARVDQTSVLGKAGYDFSDTVRLDLVNQWFDKSQGLPDWRNNESTEASLDTQRNIATVKLTADDLGKYHLNTATQISYSWKEEEYDDRLGQIGLGRQHTCDTTSRISTNFYTEWLTEFNALSLMLDYQHEMYKPDDLLNSTTSADSNRDFFSAGLQNSFFLWAHQLTLTPALRYTYIHDELESAVSSHGVSLEGRTRSEDYFSPQVGLRYQPADWLVIRSNLAKYVREPSFFELFGDRGFFTGNEDLEAEEGVNFDIGFEVNWQTGNRWLSRVSLNAAWFHSDVDNLITQSFDARGVGKSVNISESEIFGYETALRVDFLKYLRLVANATWQDTANKSEIAAFSGKHLPGRFSRSYLTRLEGIFGGVRTWVEYIKDENMYYDTANLLPAEDKEEVNIGLSWMFSPVLLTLEARNIQDNQYEDFNGYPMPGEAYYATVKYSW